MQLSPVEFFALLVFIDHGALKSSSRRADQPGDNAVGGWATEGLTLELPLEVGGFKETCGYGEPAKARDLCQVNPATRSLLEESLVIKGQMQVSWHEALGPSGRCRRNEVRRRAPAQEVV